MNRVDLRQPKVKYALFTGCCNIPQVSAARRRSAKRPKMSPASADSCKASGHQERNSQISCECQQAAGSRRCSMSPEPEGREGKENKDWDGCGVDKQQPGSAERHESRGPFFPDEDSNQILPVEHFFGNMDIVQVRRIIIFFFFGFLVCSDGTRTLRQPF